MVHFVGAGPGALDLLTRRGTALLAEADVVVYAGSLVNPALLGLCRQGCSVYNSAEMTLEQVIGVLERAHRSGQTAVRLHTGDPCLYGAIREQMDALDRLAIPYDDTHGATMVVFLSAGMLPGLQEALLQGAYTRETPAAIVFKATWPEEKVVRCSLGALAETGRQNGISHTALVLVGDFLRGDYERSKLYDPAFSTGFREAERGE